MALRRGHGEGSVFQRHAADCRKRAGAKTCVCPWYAQIDHGWIGGKRVRPTRVAARDDGKRPTKSDAVRTLEAMRLEKRAGVITSAAPLSTWLDASGRVRLISTALTETSETADAVVSGSLGEGLPTAPRGSLTDSKPNPRRRRGSRAGE